MTDDLRPDETGAVSRLAALARLRLTSEEAADLARQLGRILDYVEQIRAIDTSGVEPLAHPFGDAAGAEVLREDVCEPGLTPESALANAPDPDRTDGLFKVPRVLG